MLVWVKKIIPLGLKQRLKNRLLKSRLAPLSRWMITKDSGPITKTGADPTARGRPCVDEWSIGVCECDMHIGAFKQARIFSKIKGVLDAAGIEYVDDIYEEHNRIAVSLALIPKVKMLLSEKGMKYEENMVTTKVNQYDFPTTRSGLKLSEMVPKRSPEVRVLPAYFCKERRADARNMSVAIVAFTEVDDIRCFHCSSAKVRTRSNSYHSSREKNASYSKQQQDIDIVITTVDGSDPDWQKKYDSVLSSGLAKPTLAKTINRARYTSHDELRYVLRSIYYYAPYVRKIHIVTDQQCPQWLDVNSKKIHLVDHTDIIDEEYLPTFNSDAIESFLWRIPGLSEQFLYFNDDVFLFSPTSRSTFYTSHGVPRFFSSPRGVPEIPASWADSYTMHAHLQSAAALDAKGYGRPSTKFKHAPFVCLKSTFERLENEFQDELTQTRERRVRSEGCYATISFLYPNFALASKNGVLTQLSYDYIDLSWADWERRLLKTCQRSDIKVACINESNDALESSSNVDEKLARILNARFPAVPPWEIESGVGQ